MWIRLDGFFSGLGLKDFAGVLVLILHMFIRPMPTLHDKQFYLAYLGVAQMTTYVFKMICVVSDYRNESQVY